MAGVERTVVVRSLGPERPFWPTTRRLRPRASLYKRRRRRQRPDGGRFNDPDTICKGPEALTS